MTIVLKNYPSVVDAKAYLVHGDWNELTDGMIAFVNANANTTALPNNIQSKVTDIVGVTFDDADEAIRDIYDVDWSQCIHYGDMTLVGMKKKMMSLPDDTYFIGVFINDRGETLVVMLNIKNAFNPANVLNTAAMPRVYCRIGIRDVERENKTFVTFFLMRDDENLLRSNTMLQFCSTPDGVLFSSSGI